MLEKQLYEFSIPELRAIINQANDLIEKKDQDNISKIPEQSIKFLINFCKKLNSKLMTGIETHRLYTEEIVFSYVYETQKVVPFVRCAHSKVKLEDHIKETLVSLQEEYNEFIKQINDTAEKYGVYKDVLYDAIKEWSEVGVGSRSAR